jgi:hypothetical protein
MKVGKFNKNTNFKYKKMVELRRLELLTPYLQSRCSPN